MKRKSLFVFAGLGFVTAVAAVTVFTARYKNAGGDLFMQNVEALTENEDSGCPGGQCTTTYADGGSCTACCASGQSPFCDSYGCSCI